MPLTLFIFTQKSENLSTGGQLLKPLRDALLHLVFKNWTLQFHNSSFSMILNRNLPIDAHSQASVLELSIRRYEWNCIGVDDHDQFTSECQLNVSSIPDNQPYPQFCLRRCLRAFRALFVQKMMKDRMCIFVSCTSGVCKAVLSGIDRTIPKPLSSSLSRFVPMPCSCLYPMSPSRRCWRWSCNSPSTMPSCVIDVVVHRKTLCKIRRPGGNTPVTLSSTRSDVSAA